MKIVVNNRHGGFSVTEKVYKELGLEWDKYGYLKNKHFGIVSINENAYRAHPKLIAAIEKIGLDDSSGKFADLAIVEIPDDVVWCIQEYDGWEWVAEVHRTWKPWDNEDDDDDEEEDEEDEEEKAHINSILG